jgi:hypothetical protein
MQAHGGITNSRRLTNVIFQKLTVLRVASVCVHEKVISIVCTIDRRCGGGVRLSLNLVVVVCSFNYNTDVAWLCYIIVRSSSILTMVSSLLGWNVPSVKHP